MSRNRHAVFGPTMANGHLGTAYAPDAEGGAEGNQAWYGRKLGTYIDPMNPAMLRGLREDDAALLLKGLREDDADLRLRGLREDDADLRLRGTEDHPDFWPGAEAAAADQYGKLAGGQPRMMVSNGRTGHMGGLREDDADLRLRGLREDDADLRLKGLREDDAALLLRGLREDDADLRLRGAYSPDAEGAAEGNQAWYSRSAKMGTYIDPMNPAMMRGRGFHDGFQEGFHGNRFKSGFQEGFRSSLGMEVADYQDHRFPVTLEIKGLGKISGQMSPRRAIQVAGIFDFLTGRPEITWDEALTRLRTVIDQESKLKARLDRLSPAGQASVITQVNAMKFVNLFDGQQTAIFNEGKAGWDAHIGRTKRLIATEQAIPVIDKVITQLEQGMPPGAANQLAIDEINKKIAALPKENILTSYVLPAVGGAAAIGLLIALV